METGFIPQAPGRATPMPLGPARGGGPGRRPRPGRQRDDSAQFTVQTAKVRQIFDGLGAGAIFYEGHITSLAARNKNERQQQLYDDMFASVPTRYLQLMIRETHEPKNDNDDPYTPAFDGQELRVLQAHDRRSPRPR